MGAMTHYIEGITCGPGFPSATGFWVQHSKIQRPGLLLSLPEINGLLLDVGPELGGHLVGFGMADVHPSLLTSFHQLFLCCIHDESFPLCILIRYFPPPFRPPAWW